MKKQKDFKVAIGAKVCNDTGHFIIKGYMNGADRFYVCDYASNVNPANNKTNMQIRENDINNLQINNSKNYGNNSTLRGATSPQQVRD